MSQSVLGPSVPPARRVGRADLARPRAPPTPTYTPKKVVLGEHLVVPEICLGTMTWGSRIQRPRRTSSSRTFWTAAEF